jgi:hypothetical protein
MKKLTLLIFILLVSLEGICQKYIPFDLSNGLWTCEYFTKGGFFDFYQIDGEYGSDYVTENVKFYFNGDTLINDTLFTKLYYIGIATPTTTPQRNIYGYFGAIRNDSLRKMVWFNDKVLYDFNLQLGDSYKYNCDESENIIYSIDSVLYCNKYHNFKDSQNNNQFIIEGIGSSYGLIPIKCSLSNSNLKCYSEKNKNCDTCKIPNIIRSVSTNNLSVFPNPTNNYVIISSEATISLIEIIDITGRIIYAKNGFVDNKIEIPIQTNGYYILKIKTINELIVSSLIKK